MWSALASISEREDRSINELATEIDGWRGKTSTTSAVRVFVLAYFQKLAELMEQTLASSQAHLSGRPTGTVGAIGIEPTLREIFGQR